MQVLYILTEINFKQKLANYSDSKNVSSEKLPLNVLLNPRLEQI